MLPDFLYATANASYTLIIMTGRTHQLPELDDQRRPSYNAKLGGTEIRYVARSRMMFQKWALPAVLAVWAGMTSIALAYVLIFGHDVPMSEDWLMVPALVGQQPNLIEWLWTPNNEHRLPLQKAIYLILLKISGGDFRIGAVVDTLIISTLCLVMILTARHLRNGRTRFSDVFFPLILLHLGHLENLIWGWQIQFVVSTMLICVWLLIIVRERWPLPLGPASAAGIILVLLPLSGANGVLFMPFVAIWLGVGVLLHSREISPRWITPFLGACVIASFAFTGLYFVGWVSSSPYPNPGFWPTLLTGARFVGMSIGPVAGGAGRSYYPGHIRSSGVLFSATFILLASVIIPLRHALHQVARPERSRLWGLLVFGAGMAALVIAIAWGRAGWVPHYGMPDRYALLSVPGLCAAYFTWVLYGPEIIRDRMAIAFATTSLVALPFNVREGNWLRHYYTEGMTSFELDLSAGLSWQDLGDRHFGFLLHWDRDALIERMQMLHDAHIGPFSRANPR